MATAFGRGFLAGVVRKKLGLNLISEKADGGRIYRIKEGKASSATPVKQAVSGLRAGPPTRGRMLVPLVMVLHGCRQTEVNMINETRFKDLAERDNFIRRLPLHHLL